ncbi:protein of unknown function DUF362 [Solidesulfovibrio carbinoliphilus subsp. oakridgensis]|uniref:DUF362 domain-containing protein n=1 Tax=Solidesulfovibrio carbinoliphilus subsp. oakridgensis TaxID=694327 RepID=G7QE39_9BACT|nr:DUF362 domain-containing protein [Solidesulfovibrio carbinoliphilus]EHJ46695.1 protein of unknown function DUF362 [Solidesulfovibrio carbinoliphilus subsp. oakridgensis]
MSHSIFLRRVAGYDDPGLDGIVSALLAAAGCQAGRGDRVLVKPNLVAPRNPSLSCSHPSVVRAVCRHLIASGARVTVADSPAFGTGRIVARLTGLTEALANLPVRVASLDCPRPVRLSGGGTIGVSRLALEADHIVNVPRLKCHDQMGLTLAVKNFFGCVCGFRKSLAHQRLGKCLGRFARMLLDVSAALPPSTSLLDGVVAMHKAGPVGGEAFALGLLAAAANPVALDTAIYARLGLSPESIPLWREALALDLPGSRADEVHFPMETPDAFDVAGFMTPRVLAPLAFEPSRFVRGRVRSLLVTFGRGGDRGR